MTQGIAEFDSWWYASKYCQVGTDDSGLRRAALDGWLAGLKAQSVQDTQLLAQCLQRIRQMQSEGEWYNIDALVEALQERLKP